MTDWETYYFELFEEQLKELADLVNNLKSKDPCNYKTHETTKLLARVLKSIKDTVPTDPKDKQFFVGNTMGPQYRAWRRVKRGLPQRYRLFFKFSTDDCSIVYAWLNNKYTLRQEGSKTDVYEVFKKMLNNKTIPDKYHDLKSRSERF